MRKQLLRKQILRLVEELERRACPAVTAALSNDGDLVVSGDADGPVEIVAQDADTYQVTDNGVVVGTVDGVKDDIRIKLSGTGSGADDTVTIDRAGQAVDQVMADLGAGANSLTVQGGTVHGRLRYTGGSGADTLHLASTADL